MGYERAWVPQNKNGSLYIRPLHIANNAFLGVAPPNKSKIMIIANPCGNNYLHGVKLHKPQPLSVLADPFFVRAWPNGRGSARCGGNYAPMVRNIEHANEMGCDNIMWLFDDGNFPNGVKGDPLVMEAGSMNLFVVWYREEDGRLELITPPLDDNIVIPGVVRDSCMKIPQEWDDVIVTERFFRWSEFSRAIEQGRVREVFGTGTSSYITVLGKVLSKVNKEEGEWIDFPVEREIEDSISNRLCQELHEIKHLGKPAPNGEKWLYEC